MAQVRKRPRRLPRLQRRHCPISHPDGRLHRREGNDHQHHFCRWACRTVQILYVSPPMYFLDLTARKQVRSGSCLILRCTAAYCASKAAIIGFTRAMTEEYASRGIRCNALCPGCNCFKPPIFILESHLRLVFCASPRIPKAPYGHLLNYLFSVISRHDIRLTTSKDVQTAIISPFQADPQFSSYLDTIIPAQ